MLRCDRIADASQGLERRMTHPTATRTATDLGRPSAGNMSEPRLGSRIHHARRAPDWADSVFYSRFANFVELQHAAFHYSVIGGNALIALAPGLNGSHLLNDEVSASNSRGDTAGQSASAADQLCFNSDRTGYGVEPEEERPMQTTPVLLADCKSISRSQMSE